MNALKTLFSKIANIIKNNLNIESKISPLNFPSLISQLNPLSITLTNYLEGTIENYTNNSVSFLKSSAFFQAVALKTINLPKCQTIGSNCFYSCTQLSQINLPECRKIESTAFMLCNSLTSIILPKCNELQSYAFRYCQSLSTIYLLNSTVCKRTGYDSFDNTLLASGIGSIIVPGSLLSDYKKNYSWQMYSSQIFAVEDYPLPE